MSIQTLKRVTTDPPAPAGAPEWFAAAWGHIIVVSRSLRNLQNAFETRVITIPGAGTALLAVLLNNPLPDNQYALGVMPDWNTTVWVTVPIATGFTLNFGTVTPGVNQVVRIIVAR